MTPLHLNYPVSITILYAVDSEGTQDTAHQIKNALVNRGHMIRMYKVTEKNWRSMIRVSGDVIFNLVENPWPLYLKTAKALALMGRAQVGIDLFSLKYVLNKTHVKRRLEKFGLSTPRFRIVNKRTKIHQIRGLEYPLIVKPAWQHASIGITQDSVVIDAKELNERINYLFKHFAGEVIIEEFIDGPEVHVMLLGNNRHLAVMPYVGINYNGEFADNWEIFTYHAKWIESSWEYWESTLTCPVSFGKKVDTKIDKLVKQATNAFHGRDVIRFDLRIDNNGQPFIVDMNMCPSLSSQSEDECWRCAHSLKWSYEDLIETIVAITYKRVYGRLPDRLRERNLLLTTR